MKPRGTIRAPLRHVPARGVEPTTTPVLIPNGMDVHYEVELAVIVGGSMFQTAWLRKQFSREEYEQTLLRKIAGYAIGTNSRDLQWFM